MTTKRTLAFLCGLGLSFAGSLHAFNVDFSKNRADALFEQTDSISDGSDGAVTLPARVDSHPIEVKGGKKYRLEIVAEVEGDLVTEVNDRAHILTLQSHRYQLGSMYEIIFLNDIGEEIRAFGATQPGHHPTSSGFFLTRTRQPYVAVFYAPEEAVNLKVRFHPHKRRTHIASLKLEEETGEGTVNPNPDFRYGELSYSGWQPQRDGRIYQRPDGKRVFVSGYGGASPFFPVSPERTYRFSVVGLGTGGSKINVQYYDREGKMIVSNFLFRAVPEGVETLVTPPANTVMARILMYGTLLESFKVVEVK